MPAIAELEGQVDLMALVLRGHQASIGKAKAKAIHSLKENRTNATTGQMYT
jgi:hypothetical protein